MSSFSRKHYKDIAQVINQVRHDLRHPHFEGESAVAGISLVEGGLIELFEKDNPRFDASRFTKACREG